MGPSKSWKIAVSASKENFRLEKFILQMSGQELEWCREVTESPSLEMFRKCGDAVLRNLVWWAILVVGWTR